MFPPTHSFDGLNIDVGQARESERQEKEGCLPLTSRKSVIFSSNNGTCSRLKSGATDFMAPVAMRRALSPPDAEGRGPTREPKFRRISVNRGLHSGEADFDGSKNKPSLCGTYAIVHQSVRPCPVRSCSSCIFACLFRTGAHTFCSGHFVKGANPRN